MLMINLLERLLSFIFTNMKIYEHVQNISRLELFIWCFLLLGFILFNIGFWIERWTVSDLQVSTLTSVCFDRSNDRCCQTFEDRDEAIPGVL